MNQVTPPDEDTDATAESLDSHRSNDAHKLKKKKYAGWGRKAGEQQECEIHAMPDL